jgi:glycosyltransferase involved in cell wall biosynthesis
MTIALGMMVQDRAHCVEAAIQSALRFVNGCVFLDGGSTDGTQDICARYGTVIHAPWPGSYGAQRTAVMEACRAAGAEWYLMLDSDEIVTDGGDLAEQFARARHHDLDALLVNCVPITLEGRQVPEPNFRLIRTDRGMEWRYAYDEQLAGWRKGRVAYSTLTIEQDYRRNFDAAHAARRGYLEPLRAAAKLGSDPWCHASYFLMRSHMSVGDYAKAEEYARGIVRARCDSTGYASAWTTLARCALLRGDVVAAWDDLQVAAARHPGMADVWHLIAITAAQRMNAALADPGAYFVTAQASRTIDAAAVLRALGCQVE